MCLGFVTPLLVCITDLAGVIASLFMQENVVVEDHNKLTCLWRLTHLPNT